MIVVTSWDDGYPADMKIADLLDRHGLTGTFFVPIENREGRPVLDKVALRELGNRFEIGSHTHTHMPLNTIERQCVDEEIYNGKRGLEDILGHRVDGFCYPRGCITPYVVQSLRKNDVRYARTCENFRLDVGQNQYFVPTTFHIFPHKKPVYLRNYIKRGHLNKRWAGFRRAMTSDSLWDALNGIAEDCNKRDGVLHLWGHSWEIEENNLWGDLDAFFSRLKQFTPTPKTVAQSVDHILADTLYEKKSN